MGRCRPFFSVQYNIIVLHPRWRFSVALRTRQVTFPTRGVRRSPPPGHSDRLHPLANGALRSQVKSEKKTLPLSRHTCLACTQCYYYIIIFLLMLSCKVKILYTFTRSFQTSRAYWMTLWRKYNNTMRFVHLLPCTIICAMHTHTYIYLSLSLSLSHSFTTHTHTHSLKLTTHTLTGYDRGEPSPHIPRVCVRVEDAPRWRRRANARRRPAACAACRVYRTRVMR